MPHELFKDFGVPVSIALLGTFVSLLGLIISKESKVSEFRQAWIDGLRGDIAALIGYSNAIVAVKLMAIGENEKLRLAQSEYRHANEMASRIRLRLNPKKELHKPVLEALKAHEIYFSGPTSVLDTTGIDNAATVLVQETQTLLKLVWERVKKGEVTYKLCRLVFLAIVVITSGEAVFLFGWWLYHHA